MENRGLLRHPVFWVCAVVAILLSLMTWWTGRLLERLHPGGYRLYIRCRDLRTEHLARFIESGQWEHLRTRTGVSLPDDRAAWLHFLDTQPDHDCLVGLWDLEDRPLLSGRLVVAEVDGESVLEWEPIPLDRFVAVSGSDLGGLYAAHPSVGTTEALVHGGPDGTLTVCPGLPRFDSLNRLGMWRP